MDGNDGNRDAYLFADFAKRLEGITEVELYAAVEHFIESDKSAFFPQYAAVKEYLRDTFENCPWSMFYRPRIDGVELIRSLMKD